jgi:hypothetical protein
MTDNRMDRNFWRDLYPISETKRRFSRSSFLWIYLPIGASALIAVGIAVAVLGTVRGDEISQQAQLATIAMAAVLLAAGFFSWLFLLGSIWGLNDLLGVLPVFTSRMRLRFVIGARSWKRRISGIKRAAAAVSRFLYPEKRDGLSPLEKRMRTSRRGGHRDD